MKQLDNHHWPQLHLYQLVDVKHGFAFKSQFFSADGEYILLTPGNFKEEGGFRFLGIKQKYYSGSVPNGYILEKNDLLIAMTEQAPGLLGSAILIPESSKYLHNQRLGLLSIKTTNLSKRYLYCVFNSPIVRKPISATATGTKVKHTSPEKIGNIKIPVPPMDQQERIADIILSYESYIDKVSQLIYVKEKRFEYLVSQLINSTTCTRGHVRDFATEISTRNRSNQCERVLSVTNTNGFVLPEDHFERRVASADLSNYKIVVRGQYAYNPSRINVGSIARLDNWDEGVLSPMYVVFKLNEKKVNSDFFLHWLSSHEARERIKRSAQGSVRETVSFADLGAIPFPLPDMDTQTSVAEALNAAKKEIDLLKQLAGAYRKQKRGLMQKLLTGKWRIKSNKEVA
ncbi:restriction endonuclease subunit S [Alloalcanivorax xenomutans]|uniref:restriction endonuclease subunit S n=1 Tax=Alloalcanivorax xenomutans TaxID=1094342 RepID=UPI00292FE848|nr:restriction endonuclease subunit S [Alloalcanivorax xenomutans]WOA30905.1 restriction endonuclease subunit S [Alloalcanivorax xenomutans]